MKFNPLRNTSIVLLLSFLFIGNVYAAKLNVVASFSILANLIQNIGGDQVNVVSIVGPNEDTHEYELKPSDLVLIKKSEIFFINGLGFESEWIRPLLKNDHGAVIIVTKGMFPLSVDKNSEHFTDPHAWNSPQNVIKYYIPNILNALIAYDPKHKAYYEKNARVYTEKLKKLNEFVLQKLSHIPISDRQAVTTHDAFSYYAKAYSIQFIAAQGLATDSEASAKDIANLEKIIKGSQIRVVFLENMTSNKLITQISKDTGAIIGGELYSDALSKPDGPANDYIKLITTNTNTIVEAWARWDAKEKKPLN